MRTIVLCFLYTSFLIGQDISEYSYDYKCAVTYSPSALLNPYVGIQIGFEKPISNNVAVEIEAARLLRFDLNQEEQREGVRTKLGIKYLKKSGMFLAFTLYYRYSVHKHEEWLWRSNFSYEQLFSYRRTKRLFGPTVGLGYLLMDPSDRFQIELGGNLGVGSLAVTNHNLPSDAFIEEEEVFSYSQTGKYRYLIAAFSLKIKYTIGKFL